MCVYYSGAIRFEGSFLLTKADATCEGFVPAVSFFLCI